MLFSLGNSVINSAGEQHAYSFLSNRAVLLFIFQGDERNEATNRQN